MSILVCGVDIVEITEFTRLTSIRQSLALKKLFRTSEISECGSEPTILAGRFATKEAVLKAMGTGLTGIPLTDISVTGTNPASPKVHLFATAAIYAKQSGFT